jgi:uncharacterized membrane protein YgcG
MRLPTLVPYAQGWLRIVLLCSTLLFLFNARALAAPQYQSAASPVGKEGTVTTDSLNVRSLPALTGQVVGQLRSGSRVAIVGEQDGWLQIRFPAGPGGKGWVSGRFVRVGDSTAPAGPAAPAAPAGAAGPANVPPGQAPAPTPVDFRPPTFYWRWPGNTAGMNGIDWYFDVQIFQKYVQNPYFTVAVEPGAAALSGDVYSGDGPHFTVKCDSYWVAQIAIRKNGRFAGWISPKSESYFIGKPCGGSSGGGNSGSSNGGSSNGGSSNGGSSNGGSGGGGDTGDNTGPCEGCPSGGSSDDSGNGG